MISQSHNADFPIHITSAYVIFQGRFGSGGILPSFWGPTLRGAFGYQLKKTVCHCRVGDCKACLLNSHCAYGYIFEGLPPEGREFMKLYPTIPQPFVLVLPYRGVSHIQAGQRFEFGVRLFGKAIEFFPYVAYTFLQIGQQGLGKDKLLFEIEQIYQPLRGVVLYEKTSPNLTKAQPDPLPQPFRLDTNTLSVSLLTPTKLLTNGKVARHIEFKDLVRHALRRVAIFSHFYGCSTENDDYKKELMEQADHVQKIADQTEPIEINRFSGRQKRTMTLEGIIGTMRFTGDFSRYGALFATIENIHLGKAASFGFGRTQFAPA